MNRFSRNSRRGILVLVLILLLLTTETARSAQFTSPSWQIVSSTSPGTNYNELTSVAASSPTDVWAVGYYSNNLSEYPNSSVIEHFNGKAWSIFPSPVVGTSSSLSGVTAVSSSNAWAVGGYWNGTSWSIIPSPNIGRGGNSLDTVSVLSADNIWAAGVYVKIPTAAYQTETQHWNGTSWSVVTSPNVPGAHLNELEGLTAINAQDVWTVGFYEASGNIVTEMLTENYCC